MVDYSYQLLLFFWLLLYLKEYAQQANALLSIMTFIMIISMCRECMQSIIHMVVRQFHSLDIFYLWYQATAVSPIFILEIEGNNN